LAVTVAGGTGPAGLAVVEKLLALRAVPIFAALAPESLAELAHAGEAAVYEPGESLCVEGDAGDEVYVMLTGQVMVVRRAGGEADGDEVRLNTAEAGTVIGEMAVLNQAPRSATVRAGADGASVLRLRGEAFRAVLHANPEIAEAVIRTLAERVVTAEARAWDQQR
jgi:CRP-like cAMP-binding protein